MSQNFAISAFDLWDSYLPQYQMAFANTNTTKGAMGAMCS